MPWYDAWGTDQTYNHMAVGWTWAFDTPYNWTKQVPSLFGGTRKGMAISWPAQITDKGGIRYAVPPCDRRRADAARGRRHPAPDMVDGIAQKPIEGVSMAYTFDKANADAPSPHQTQYFEMLGVQRLYHDGWMLSAVPTRPPWDMARASRSRSGQRLQVRTVRPAARLDAVRPTSRRKSGQVREMTDLMFAEFAKYQVLPLDASVGDAHGRRRARRSPAAARCSPTPASRSPACRDGDCAESAQHVLQHHRRDRGAAGRRETA